MANNRMFLVHRPSGIAVPLGKRLGDGYYMTPDDLAYRIQSLHDLLERDHSATMEDLVVGLEMGCGRGEEEQRTVEINYLPVERELESVGLLRVEILGDREVKG